MLHVQDCGRGVELKSGRLASAQHVLWTWSSGCMEGVSHPNAFQHSLHAWRSNQPLGSAGGARSCSSHIDQINNLLSNPALGTP